MKIYVASSWKNALQPDVVRKLRDEGHAVYDFREPRPGQGGFAWSEIDPAWRDWSPNEFRKGLDHYLAVRHFDYDRWACEGSDATLLVLPCGRSAHLELGVAVGMGQKTAVFMPEPSEPELMYRWTNVLTSWVELFAWSSRLKRAELALEGVDRRELVAPAHIAPAGQIWRTS